MDRRSAWPSFNTNTNRAMTKKIKLKTCGPKPCNDCPWRRNSIPGWLGDAGPERFLLAIYAESPLPCHQTVDYSDPAWLKKWTAQTRGKPMAQAASGRLCTGALTFYANLHKRPRNPDLQIEVARSTSVFATPDEFLAHHRNAPSRSWSEQEVHDGDLAWRKYLAFPLPGYAAQLLEDMG